MQVFIFKYERKFIECQDKLSMLCKWAEVGQPWNYFNVGIQSFVWTRHYASVQPHLRTVPFWGSICKSFVRMVTTTDRHLGPQSEISAKCLSQEHNHALLVQKLERCDNKAKQITLTVFMYRLWNSGACCRNASPGWVATTSWKKKCYKMWLHEFFKNHRYDSKRSVNFWDRVRGELNSKIKIRTHNPCYKIECAICVLLGTDWERWELLGFRWVGKFVFTNPSSRDMLHFELIPSPISTATTLLHTNTNSKCVTNPPAAKPGSRWTPKRSCLV